MTGQDWEQTTDVVKKVHADKWDFEPAVCPWVSYSLSLSCAFFVVWKSEINQSYIVYLWWKNEIQGVKELSSVPGGASEEGSLFVMNSSALFTTENSH